MKLTNNHNLPGPIVRAVEAFEKEYRDSYGHQPSDISVTSLLNPPQQEYLKRIHDADLEEDVLDRIYALLGHSIHHILELAEDPFGSDPVLTEVRYYGEVNGWNVSGKIDRYDPATEELSDWKVCSVWEHVLGLKPEREQQLNMLAHLMRCNGVYPKRLVINSLYRDWSTNQAEHNKDYPDKQFATHEVPLWSEADVLMFMERRVQMHQLARDGRQMPCTLEDQWAKPTKYAVMKPGNKRATKLHSDLADAKQHADRIGAAVEMRKGEKTRCERYCAVRDVCPQFQQEKADGTTSIQQA